MKYSKNLTEFLEKCRISSEKSNKRINLVNLYVLTLIYLREGNIKGNTKLRKKLLSINENDLFLDYRDGSYDSDIMDPNLEDGTEGIFDQEAYGILKLAENEATITGYSEVDLCHILLSFTVYESNLKETLRNCGLNYEDVFKLIDKKKPKPMLKRSTISQGDIDNSFKDFLDRLGINGDNTFIRFTDTTSGQSSSFPFSSFGKNKNNNDDNGDEEGRNPFSDFIQSALSGSVAQEESSDGMGFLNKYGKNLNDLAAEDKFDPIHGRETEIDLLIKYLCCKKKNNVVLLGDPGVGKTTIVEGLTQRIVSGNVPSFLKDKIIFSLDLNSLVAGTKYRGQYEERLQGIIKEVTKNKNIIVFIDEFHNLVGNGSSEGAGDASNILKPYLARGEFQCIGSTTFDEYRKFIEKDGALKRRFNNIPVYEPSEEECLEMLKTLRSRYEEHHRVEYSDEVLKLCVELSERYITDRFLPDKAIDILDLSGSETKLKAAAESFNNPVEARLREINALKQVLLDEENYEELVKVKKEEEKLEKEIKVCEKATVTPETVYNAISKISGVPVDNIGSSDMAKLRKMKSVLSSKVIGQSEAVNTILLSLQKNSLGLRDAKKPIASILCVGPSGTGKTYICKQIAKEFFGSEDSLIRFDMSEYTEKHEITKLIGASASYVGYDDEPLFYKIKRKPYSVVLFDEIEKADSGIYPILLNILDEGYVTAANGTVIDFKNTIIVLTGNIGTKEAMARGTSVGFTTGKSDSKVKSIINKAVEKEFPPEFINRLSSIITFNELTREDLLKICDLEIDKFKERISKKGYKNLVVSDEIKQKIVNGCDLKYGARDLQREISKVIEESICNYLLENDVPEENKDIDISENLENKNVVVKFS